MAENKTLEKMENNQMLENKITYISQGTEFQDILSHCRYHKSDKKCIPIILSGPPGTGKSTLVEDLAKSLNCAYFEINGHPGITREDLEGLPSLINGNSVWKDGAIPVAIHNANKNGLAVLAINEYNLMRPEIQASTNSLLDFQGRFRLTTDANRLVEIEEGNTLIVVGTLNENIEGVFPIQQSVMSRIKLYVKLNYASKEVESKILQKITGTNKEITDIVCDAASELRSAATKADATITRSISTRELISFCDAIKVPGIALKTAFDYAICNKLIEDEEEKEAIYVLLEEGKNFFRKLENIINHQTVPVSEIKKVVKKTTIINSRAFKIQRNGRYTVQEIPTLVEYEGVVYEVPQPKKWAPLNKTVVKFVPDRYGRIHVHLYTRHSRGTPAEDVNTWIRFYKK